MRVSVLINNFDYRSFVGEAVQSALDQSAPVSEIIVSDDSSTDDSVNFLRSTFGRDPRVKLLCAGENRGQFAAFQSGFREATGDIIFFLDADDCYRADYLERALEAYAGPADPDFVFSDLEVFGDRHENVSTWPVAGDLGLSVLRSWYRRSRIGGPTSALSMKRWVLDRILPTGEPGDWRLGADRCLVQGAGLVGARKYHLAEPLVRYRVHGSNLHEGRYRDRARRYRMRLATNRFQASMVRGMGWDIRALASLANYEFETIPHPTYRDAWDYIRIAFSAEPVYRTRTVGLARIMRHFLRAHGSMRRP